VVLSQLAGRPNFTPAQVQSHLRDRWGVDGDLTPLVSERDQNWLVRVDGSPVAVAKIANRADEAAHIDLQRQMMQRLHAAGLPCPDLLLTINGGWSARLGEHVSWMIGFLPGTTLATTDPAPGVFEDLGRVLAAVSLTLADFDHPAAHRVLQWDITRAPVVFDAYADAVVDSARRALIDQAATRFADHVRPRLDELPRGIIHNDANDHNVLIEGDRVSGLVDFGDAVHTALVVEPAVACAYAMLDRPDPRAVRDLLIAGYEQHRPLHAVEREVLDNLIRTRLAVSVCISAHQSGLVPGDAYLSVSEAPAWRLLERLMEAE
jgi:hypothetical protein